VGLHQSSGQSPHVKLHQQGTPQVPTSSSTKATACTIQSCPYPILSPCANSYNRHYSPTLQRMHQMHAGYCWHTPLLQTHSWPHHSSSHQC
jgi:hypothetical protein